MKQNREIYQEKTLVEKEKTQKIHSKHIFYCLSFFKPKVVTPVNLVGLKTEDSLGKTKESVFETTRL